MNAARRLTLAVLAPLCAITGTGLSVALRGLLRAKGSGAPSRTPVGLAFLLTIAGVLTFSAAPAAALSTHVFSSSFGGAGSGAGQLSSPAGVAVSDVGASKGDIYVGDVGNHRVDEFEASGTFIRAFGANVGGLGVNVCGGLVLCSAGTPGSGPGELTAATFVAVDNSAGPSSGDVYVGDTADNVVSKFTSAGALVASWATKGQLSGPKAATPFVEMAGVAVDGSGTLMVIDHASHLFKFAQEGKFSEEFVVARETSTHGLAVDPEGNIFKANGEPSVEELTGSGGDIGQVSSSTAATGLAVDAATGDLYVDQGGDVEHYAFSGAGIVSEQGATTCKVEPHVGCPASDAFGSGQLGAGAGLAVDPSTHTVYVADASNQRIDVFTGPVVVPDATTEAATGVSATVATLHGTVNPDGIEVAGCVFEYRTDAEQKYEHSLPCAPAPGSGSAPVAVEATLAAAANTTYHYRLSATNLHGTNHGDEQNFTTLGPPRIGSVTAVVPEGKAGQSTATLQAQVTPDGGTTEASYQFEYGETTSYGTSVPATPGAIGTGREPVVVEANLTGLKLATTYHYRVCASNEFGSLCTADHELATLPAALITDSATEVTSTTATLNAQINPLGSASSYRFEYLSEEEFKADGESFSGPDQPTLTPVPDGPLGEEGEANVTVSRPIQGLAPQTTYHYRALVTNSLAPAGFAGPDRTFLTQPAAPSAALPDSRQWQLVSPPDKHGAQLEPIQETGLIQASAGGSRIAYLATAPTEADPPANADSHVQVLSALGPAGWSSRDIATPHSAATGAAGISGPEYRAFSSDLSLAVVEPRKQPRHAFLPLSPAASEQTLYLRTDFTGSEPCTGDCYRPLVTGCPAIGPCPAPIKELANVPPGTVFAPGEHTLNTLKFSGATPDMSHVVFEEPSEVALAPGGVEGGFYEYSAGALTFVGNGNNLQSFKAISTDGSRVVFTGRGSSEQLFLRDTVSGQLLKLNEVKSGLGGGSSRPEFQFATPDGSKVFFTDHQRLTEGAGASQGLADLYECDVVEEAGELKCNLTDLTPQGSGEPADVQGHILGASADGSYLYFAANGVLAHNLVDNGTGPEAAAPGNCTGQVPPDPTHTCNLYLSHAGAITFLATVSEADRSDWYTFLGRQVARVSADGRWLAFMSQRSLTGYDNRDALSGQRDEEVFLYHAPGGEGEAGRLACASCNPSGARPQGVEYKQINSSNSGLAGGDRVWEHDTWIAANIPGWTPIDGNPAIAIYQSRYLSDSGRLFFNSSDALVPQDTNANEDVYQSEPPGVGGCTAASPTYSPSSGACLGLISSGTSKGESAFLDASESGNDVFFLTSARLTGTDVDTALDIYDAHACSAASPCLPEPPPPAPLCTGDACQQPVTPPNDVTPGSLTFSGPGNLAPALTAPAKKITKTVKCKKARKLRHGKCVKTRAKKKKKAKKATNNRRAKS